jgi:hypothetical protein
MPSPSGDRRQREPRDVERPRERLRAPEREDDLRRAGTLPPARRASESPIAIACLRLVTRLPDPPERSVPRLRSCIARSTFSEAFSPYFRPPLFLVAMFVLLVQDASVVLWIAREVGRASSSEKRARRRADPSAHGRVYNRPEALARVTRVPSSLAVTRRDPRTP